MESAPPIARIMLPTVRILFRDFLVFYIPCKISEIHPTPALTVVFEHETTRMPNANQMSEFKKLKNGDQIGIAGKRIGNAHVASTRNDSGNLTFVLNGSIQAATLETSIELYKQVQRKVTDANESLIRQAIFEAFAKRAKDFSSKQSEWTCTGSGLFTLERNFTPLQQRFIPEGWNPVGEPKWEEIPRAYGSSGSEPTLETSDGMPHG